MKILKKSSNHTKAINDIRKYENALDQRRTLPHNVLAPIQEKLMLNHPVVDISKTWLGNRLKSYKDYDRLGIFKETGRKGIAEVRGQLEVSTLEQMRGVQSTDDHNNNDNKDDGNIEEEEKEEEEGAHKQVIETMTLSLRSIVRLEMEFSYFFERPWKRRTAS